MSERFSLTGVWPKRVSGPVRGLQEMDSKPQVGNRLTRPPHLREATFEDHAQIASLESRYGLESKSYEEWKHLWTSNPAYLEVGKRWPIGWVLEEENKRIVGYLGNIPLCCEFQARKLLAAATYAWVVDSSYRSYSVLLLDCYFSQKNVDLYLSTTVNSQSSKAFQAFNSTPVPVGAWDQSAFWITHYRGFAASWIRATSTSARLRKLTPASFLSYPVSAGLFLMDSWTGRVVHGDRREAKVEFCTHFDHRFDVFWEKLRRRNSARLLSVRTPEVLEWHFRYALGRDGVWILTVSQGSDLAAYSIFCRQDNPRFGLKRMRFVDFQALDPSAALLRPMFSRALQRCKEERIHMLEGIGIGLPQRAIFSDLMPHQRTLPSWLYFYKARDPKIDQSLTDPAVWDPTGFDGDSSL
jgi:hypothetical protein